MCDTVAIVQPGRVWFAKNSDRDINEPQALEWRPRGTHPNGARLKCTWIDIPEADRTHAILISRPIWGWGAEMGANEHGVVIGNEAVFTRQPYAKTGLTGMDLIRLALERADSAKRACEVIAGLLAEHGQGGACARNDPSFTYHNSFIVADRARAFVLETAGREWAIEEVSGGVRTISNALTIPGFAGKHSDFLITHFAKGRLRRARTQCLAESASSVRDLFLILRDHGTGRETPKYDLFTGGLIAPCVHAGGLVKSVQTTASWVAELTPDGARHWVTGTAAPCTGLFKPVYVNQPLELAPSPGDGPDDSLWWRHERLHRAVARNPRELMPLFASERDAVEARWVAEPPEPREAFAEGDRLLARWTETVLARRVGDVRPFWARRCWRVSGLGSRVGVAEAGFGKAGPLG